MAGKENEWIGSSAKIRVGGLTLTRKQLESYQINKRLIEWNRKKIVEEKKKEIPVVMGTVKGSSSEFPYLKQRFSVEMSEPNQNDRSAKRIILLEEEIRKAEQEMEEVKEYIFVIEDIRVREVLYYRYIDGMTTREVGEKIGYTCGRVSQIISSHLKD